MLLESKCFVSFGILRELLSNRGLFTYCYYPKKIRDSNVFSFIKTALPLHCCDFFVFCILYFCFLLIL